MRRPLLTLRHTLREAVQLLLRAHDLDACTALQHAECAIDAHQISLPLRLVVVRHLRNP